MQTFDHLLAAAYWSACIVLSAICLRRILCVGVDLVRREGVRGAALRGLKAATRRALVLVTCAAAFFGGVMLLGLGYFLFFSRFV